MTYQMGAPEMNYIAKTVECPICGREGRAAGFDLVNCPVHGYTEKTPLKVSARTLSRATVA